MSKFHGISNADELKKTWKNLTNRPEDEINVLWNFDGWLMNGLNIININPNKNETGHWCCSVLLPHNKVIYYNPIQKQIKQTILNNSIYPNQNLPNDEGIMNLLKHYDVLIDLTGEQQPTGRYSSSCGYYCLEKLRDYIMMKPITQSLFVSRLSK